MIRRSPIARSTKPIPRKRAKPRRGPVKDPKYLDWIRSQPCCVCNRLYPWLALPSEAAHVGRRGLGQKCDDREALPICTRHHRTGAFSVHVLGKGFWTHYGLDRDKLIAEYQERYDAEAH